MIVARSLAEISRDSRSVVTVGTFDGVHRGHQQILRRTAELAGSSGGRSVVITFNPHPKSVLQPAGGTPIRILTTIQERESLLRTAGIDVMVVLPFTREFSRLSAEEFIKLVLVDGVGLHHIVVGHDHHFGKGREGGVTELVRQGAVLGFSIERIPAFTLDGVTVSSSSIRAALESGDVALANRQLGYEYMFAGKVIEGDRRGAGIGFPTANLEPLAADKMLPGRGVYVVAAECGSLRRYGMMNIGVRPTVSEGVKETREVHLFDFQGDLYGQEMIVRIMAHLREERRFPSLQDLVQQLGRDREASLRVITQLELQSS